MGGKEHFGSTLTEREAFEAMYMLLEKYYQKFQYDDFGALLGSLSLLPDGHSADPAAEEDWLEGVARAKRGERISALRLTRK